MIFLRLDFNPRPPWGGRRPADCPHRSSKPISIHALRGEGDNVLVGCPANARAHFNPRPPWGGRPPAPTRSTTRRDFNPRPPWGGRQTGFRLNCSAHLISIHALRGEGDMQALSPYQKQKHFNPRPPWGGRPITEKVECKQLAFQSTPSVGRATPFQRRWQSSRAHFNPRPPWGGRQEFEGEKPPEEKISIHALRGEGDHTYIFCLCRCRDFNPRPPWGGRLAT